MIQKGDPCENIKNAIRFKHILTLMAQGQEETSSFLSGPWHQQRQHEKTFSHFPTQRLAHPCNAPPTSTYLVILFLFISKSALGQITGDWVCYHVPRLSYLMDRCLLRALEAFLHPGDDCGYSPFGGDGGSGMSPWRAALFARAVVLACDVTVSHHAAGFPLLSAVGHGIALRAWVGSLQETNSHSQLLILFIFYTSAVFPCL